MALFSGEKLYKGFSVLCWLDPKRYRVTIWKKPTPQAVHYTVHVKTLHDKDPKRIMRRAKEWIDKYSASDGVTER